jgi:hypothetical protein
LAIDAIFFGSEDEVIAAWNFFRDAGELLGSSQVEVLHYFAKNPNYFTYIFERLFLFLNITQLQVRFLNIYNLRHALNDKSNEDLRSILN